MKRTKKSGPAGEKGPVKKKAEEKKSRQNKITAPASTPGSASAPGGAEVNLVCPICSGEIKVKVAFSNIYCGYHLAPSCPGNCPWPDEFRYDLMRKITELHYEHPELFKTDAELTAESLSRLEKER